MKKNSPEMIKQVAAVCMSAPTEDNMWREFLYFSRPKNDGLFASFKPQWKKDLETNIARQMVIVLSAAHVAGGILSNEDVEALCQNYGRDPESLSLLDYKHPVVAYFDLKARISNLLKTPSSEWIPCTQSALNVDSLPDKDFQLRVNRGCERFVALAQNLMP